MGPSRAERRGEATSDIPSRPSLSRQSLSVSRDPQQATTSALRSWRRVGWVTPANRRLREEASPAWASPPLSTFRHRPANPLLERAVGARKCRTRHAHTVSEGDPADIRLSTGRGEDEATSRPPNRVLPAPFALPTSGTGPSPPASGPLRQKCSIYPVRGLLKPPTSGGNRPSSRPARSGRGAAGDALVTNRACHRNAARSKLGRLRLRVETDKLERLSGEGEVASLAGGEFGVEDPAAFDGPLESCSRMPLRRQRLSRWGRTARSA